MTPTRPAIGEDAETFARLFTLAPEDLELIAGVRGAGPRLGFALQLAWARARRVLVADPRTLPPALVKFIAAQLAVPPEALAHNQRGPRTRAMDTFLIRSYLQLRAFQPEDAERLKVFLRERAAHTGNAAALLDLADDWMQSERLLRPSGATIIERLVCAARHEAEEALFAQIAGQLKLAERAQLDELCATDQGDSPRMTLAAPGKHPTGPVIEADCKRLWQARAFLPAAIDWGEITTNRRRQWATVVRRQNGQALRRHPPEKRYTLLAAFLQVRAEDLTDAIVEMIDVLVARAFKESEKALRQSQDEEGRTLAASARDIDAVLDVLLDDNVPAEQVRTEAFRRVPRDRLLQLAKQREARDQTQAAALFKQLQYRLPSLRTFMPAVVNSLVFASPRAENELLVALAMLKAFYQDRKRPLPADAPRGFVPQRWSRIVAPGGTIDSPKWELCLLAAVRQALRAGELTVAGSRRYTP